MSNNSSAISSLMQQISSLNTRISDGNSRLRALEDELRGVEAAIRDLIVIIGSASKISTSISKLDCDNTMKWQGEVSNRVNALYDASVGRSASLSNTLKGVLDDLNERAERLRSDIRSQLKTVDGWVSQRSTLQSELNSLS